MDSKKKGRSELAICWSEISFIVMRMHDNGDNDDNDDDDDAVTYFFSENVLRLPKMIVLP